MPIVRTYQCPDCYHRMEVTLSQAEWDKPPPSCQACDAREMNQEFKPPAIGGSVRMRASAIAEDILANDYHVANYTSDRRQGGVGKTRYKDESPNILPSSFQKAAHAEILNQAIAIGRQTRADIRRAGGLGDGLDILKRGIATGVQPDLIENSKRRAIKVW
jgi:hypothetical protein